MIRSAVQLTTTCLNNNLLPRILRYERETRNQLFDSSYPISEPNPNLIRARLNFAENMLLSHANARSTTALALVSIVEPDPTIDPKSPAYLESTFLRQLTYEELYQEVRQLAHVLKRMGVKPGDRVAAYAPSCIEMVSRIILSASCPLH